MKSEKGVTLIALIITIVVLIILSFTLAVNIEPYKERKAETNFKLDIQRLNEEINQYYARMKTLPIINRYTNLSMLEGIRNLNDNNNYYVIDIKQLEVTLNNGLDYETIVTRGKEADVNDLVDVYIINEKSHTIYYPNGVTYGGRTHYRIPEVYSEMSEVEVVPYWKPYIPNGFTYVGGDWNSGYTIRGVTENTDDEFVWVPCVTDQSKVKDGDTVVTFGRILPETTEKTDIYYKYNEWQLTDITDGDNSAQEIRKSVEKYGGFYIAKYEAGINNTEDDNYSLPTETPIAEKPLSQAGKGVWNYITRADAITVSKAMVNQQATGVKSTLISGEAWDTTLQWMVKASDNKNNVPNKNYDIYSKGKGWYSETTSNNTRHTTGYYPVNNIYDMAGNVWEWTTESCMVGGVSRLVIRGGSCYGSGSDIPAAYRDGMEDGRNFSLAFRVLLYK